MKKINWNVLAGIVLMACIMIVSNISLAETSGKKPDGYKGSLYTTDSTLASKLTKLFKGEAVIFTNTQATYPIGSYMSTSYKYTWIGGWGKQCYAYAQAVYYYLFGETPVHGDGGYSNSELVSGVKGKNKLDFQTLYEREVGCGSYIRTTPHASGAYDGDTTNAHSMIVLTYDTESITIYHGNYGGGLVTITTYSWDEFNNMQLSGKGRYISHIVRPNLTAGTIASSELMRRFTKIIAENKGFCRLVGHDGYIKEWPYNDAENVNLTPFRSDISRDALTNDDLLEITGAVENINHEIWMKVSAKKDDKQIIGYVKMGNLELVYKITDQVKRTGYTNGAVVFSSLPIIGAKRNGSTIFGKKLELVGSYQDADGNNWYELANNNGYILSDVVTDIVAISPTLTFSGAKAGDASNPEGYPAGNLNVGKGFGLRGTVKCSEPLRSVTGRIINEVTNYVREVTVNTSSTSYMIDSRGGINSQLVFGSLDVGVYRYEISAVTSSGYSKVLLTSEFTVGGAALPDDIKIDSLDVLFAGLSIPDGEISLDKYNENSLGNTLSVAVVPYPQNASDQSFVWTSSNPNVTEPLPDPYDNDSRNVNMKLKGFGTTTITATAQDGSGKSVSFTVKVSCSHPETYWLILEEPGVNAEGLKAERCARCYETLSYESIPPTQILVSSINIPGLQIRDVDGVECPCLELYKYDTYALGAVAYPVTATCTELSFESGNENVVTVDECGNVYGWHSGNAFITVSANDGSGVVSQVFVTVSSRAPLYRLGINPTYNPPIDAGSYVEVDYDSGDENSIPVFLNVRESGFYTITAKSVGLKYGPEVWRRYPLPSSDEDTGYLGQLKQNGNLFANLVYLDSYTETGSEYCIWIDSSIFRTDYPTGSVEITLQKNNSIAVEPTAPLLEQTISFTQPGQKFVFAKYYDNPYDMAFKSSGDLTVVGTIYDVYGNVIATNMDDIENNNFLFRQDFKPNTLYYYEVGLRDPNATGDVTVEIRPYIAVTGIYSMYYNDYCHIDLIDGEQYLQCSVNIANADNPNLVYEEIDNDICQVTRDGLVIPRGQGITTVRVWAEEDPLVYLEITVEVYNHLGDDISCSFIEGTLIISGTGPMREDVSAAAKPWWNYRDDITKIIIEPGVTSVAAGEFYLLKNVKTVIIPESVTNISSSAFNGCSSLATVFYRGTETRWNSLVTIGANNTALENATVYCRNTSISSDYELPASLVSIEDEAFANLPDGLKILIPATVTSIAPNAFDRKVILFVASENIADWAEAHGYEWTIK